MTDLIFDPGVTTGIAVMKNGAVLWTDTTDRLLGIGNALDYANLVFGINRIIYEEYIIFASKAKAHINSRVYPIQVVGVIRYLSYIHHIPLVPLQPRVKASVPLELFEQTLPKDRKISEHEKDTLRLGLYQHLLDQQITRNSLKNA